MLLRRITQHVKDQNWFAVFVDFVIVVIGVFIGIQVTNWNTERYEQSLERGYLERLANEVLESRDHTQRVTDSWIAQAGHLNLVLDSLDDCRMAARDKDDFAEGIYNLGKFEMAYQNMSTLEEMKSTGRLGIIQSVAISDALSELEIQINYQERVELQMIARLGPHIEYVNQRVRIEVNSIDQASKLNENSGDGSGSFGDAISFNLEELCKDPKVAASISSVRADMYEIMAWNLRVIDRMDAALGLISKELEK